MSKADLAFSAPFSLCVKRNDYVHAFVAYFDIQFSACHKPIHFSTGPHAKYTHWKQTVFYLKDNLVVSEKDQIEGTLTCRPNLQNPRDLDIQISYQFMGEDPSEDTLEYRMC